MLSVSRVPPLLRALCIAGLCSLLIGCATTSGAAPANTPDAPTTTEATNAPSATNQTPAATAATAPTLAPSPATAGVAAGAATVNASAATGTATTLILDMSASRAMYHAQEQLVGHNLPSEAVGASTAVSGSLVLAADGAVVSDQSQINVDLRKLASDESRRDNFIQGNTLQTNRYPVATFVPTRTVGLAYPLPTSGQSTFDLSGDLTVHGVTRPVTWHVTAQFSTTGVSGNATTQVNISDFGMTPPKAGPVLGIQDGVTLELAFQASRQG